VKIYPKAHELKLALEAGLIKPSAVICWADQFLSSPDGYNDTIADIALSSEGDQKNLVGLLTRISDISRPWEALGNILFLFHEALVSEPTRVFELARFLEKFWIRNNYEAPREMSFMVGLVDDLDLAQSGAFGSIEDIVSDLLDALSRFPIDQEWPRGI
jgi:hypothetical protein